MTDKEVFEIVLALAEGEENIRAVLLEGSRANPNAVADKWQDYDIAYVTNTNAPYIDGHWIRQKLLPHFGKVAIMQIPDNGDPNDVYTWLIQFSSGIRIDLTFNSIAFLSKPNVKLESATRVLLDKDNRFCDLTPANDSDYFPQRPSESEFLHCCNEFWWIAAYVAKALARNQTLLAIELLDKNLRPEYARMLVWHGGAFSNYSVNFGKHNCDIEKFVPDKFYSCLLRSYPLVEKNAISNALIELLREFQNLAKETADKLGYKYNCTEEQSALKFLCEFYGIET